jgi:hypothetical protein
MDIKSGRSFQGQRIRGKNKIRLNTDGRNRIGSHDWENYLQFIELQI